MLVAPVAGPGIPDTEGHLGAMAIAAELTAVHVAHGVRFAPLHRRDYFVMTISTDVTPPHMQLMAEGDATDRLFLEIIPQCFGYRMALFTGTGNIEGSIPLMAHTAGLPFLHICHTVTFVTFTGDKRLIMAVIAAIQAKVKLVAENSTGRPEVDFFYRVAFITVFLHSKCRFPVMAAAAPFPFFHLFHGDAPCGNTGAEHRIMAVTALEHAGMDFMTKDHRTGLFHLKGNVPGGLVAFIAIPLNGKSNSAVMTGTAGKPFFHLDHVMGLVLRIGLENFAVTVVAAIHFQMTIMAEKAIIAIFNIPYRMAFPAILGYGKSSFPVMAGTA